MLKNISIQSVLLPNTLIRIFKQKICQISSIYYQLYAEALIANNKILEKSRNFTVISNP